MIEDGYFIQFFRDDETKIEDWNGYTPNPSDFIEPDKYDGKYDSLMKKWG